MNEYPVVIPGLSCVVAMQIHKKARRPFEKGYSTLRRGKTGFHKRVEKIFWTLKEVEKIFWTLIKKIVGIDERHYDPIDYDRLIKILDADDPLIVSGCIDILFDMGIITAEWHHGRRVLRTKSEAFDTIENMYEELRSYAALG